MCSSKLRRVKDDGVEMEIFWRRMGVCTSENAAEADRSENRIT
jgi:hypothetical protein